MTYKRLPTAADVEKLAAGFSQIWRAGDPVRPWLRQNADVLSALVRREWSWDGLAAALNLAKITYQTGNPWTGRRLNREFYRANRKVIVIKKETAAHDVVSTEEPLISRFRREPTTGRAEHKVATAVKPNHQHPPAPRFAAEPDNARPPPARHFVFKNTPRIAPPAAPTDEEIARRDALEARLFGKKEE